MTNLALHEVIEFSKKQEWDGYQNSHVAKARDAVENALIRYPLPNKLLAYCGCCASFQMIEFTARMSAVTPQGGLALAFSESGVCPKCLINSRMRFACEMIRDRTDAQPGAAIYLTERKTNLFNSLSAYGLNCHGSEWLGIDKTPGEVYGGIEHQDIHHLTFGDDSFDIVASLDVLEHVNDPARAIDELHRVLKPGGLGVVTFPFHAAKETSVTRARFKDNGEIEKLEPEVFHGNPLGGGALVFTDFGWDFIAGIQRKFGDNMSFANYWSLYGAHFGRNRFVLVLRK